MAPCRAALHVAALVASAAALQLAPLEAPPSAASLVARLASTPVAVERSLEEDIHVLARVFHRLDNGTAAPTDAQNPKCDQVCTNGDLKQRQTCNGECALMQKKLCWSGFIGCHRACENDNPELPKDLECERLCNHTVDKICYPLKYKAPMNMVSPHHNDQIPPSIEATPPPRIFSGEFPICNLYPSEYDFEVLQLEKDAQDGPVLTTLGYKQCDKITMSSYQHVGLRARGQIAAISRKILKIPSVMVFGQWAHGNNQVEFNRYFAKGMGPMVCNGYPLWQDNGNGTSNVAQPVQLIRGGYAGHRLSMLRYKECMPTGLQNGEQLAMQIRGQDAGTYTIVGSPSAIVIGKAGHTTSPCFEAWSDNQVGPGDGRMLEEAKNMITTDTGYFQPYGHRSMDAAPTALPHEPAHF